MKTQAIITNKQSGFTLIETVVAILILSLSLGALLTLSAGGLFSVRYARNQIVADNLLQESLEYIRNSRDSAVLRSGTPVTWSEWLETFNVNANGNLLGAGADRGCFDSKGCVIDPYTEIAAIKECPSSGCPVMMFYQLSDVGFYGYEDGAYPLDTSGVTPLATTYVRRISMNPVTADSVIVTATITWRNGSAEKTTEQSILLTSWSMGL